MSKVDSMTETNSGSSQLYLPIMCSISCPIFSQGLNWFPCNINRFFHFLSQLLRNSSLFGKCYLVKRFLSTTSLVTSSQDDAQWAASSLIIFFVRCSIVQQTLKSTKWNSGWPAFLIFIEQPSMIGQPTNASLFHCRQNWSSIQLVWPITN